MKKILATLALLALAPAVTRGQFVPMTPEAVWVTAANDTTRGFVFCSGQQNNTDEAAWCLFDHITAYYKWCVVADSAWVVYQFANDDKWAVTNYVLWTASENGYYGRDPGVWELQGSNDLAEKCVQYGTNNTAVLAATWVVVDSREFPQTSAGLGPRQTPFSFSCENNLAAYNAYRLNISASCDRGVVIQFGEWTMQGHSGLPSESVLVVEGSPPGVGAVVPPFGRHIGIEPLSNIAAHVVSPVWTNSVTNVIAAVTGWETFYFDVEEGGYIPTGSGDTLSIPYIHPADAAGRILWSFAVSNWITAAVSASYPDGHVDGGGWHGVGAPVTLTPVADEGHEFFRWTGDVPPQNRYDDPLVFTCEDPVVVVAEFIPAGAAGDVRYVAEDGEDGNTGFFPTDAKRSIAAAVADLPEGGLVLVAPGQYWIYGRDPVAGQVVLDQPVVVRGVSGNPADTRVTLYPNDPWNFMFWVRHPGARVENLTISGARSFEHNNHISAGVISNCVITAGNTGNYGDKAGGIRMDGGLVTHCVISRNTIHVNENTAIGVRVMGGRLEHSLIVDNALWGDIWAPGFVAGVRASGNGSVINCTVVRNGCDSYGGVYADGDAKIVNTVIAGNATLAYSATPERAAWGGDSNCFVNCYTDTPAPINETCPAFPADILLADIAGGDFSPAPGSPLINAAINAALVVPAHVAPSVDLAGNPRVMGGVMDVGCREFNPERLSVAFNADNTLGFATAGAPAHVNFTAKVGGTNGAETLRYHWDFGDGETAEVTGSPLVSHDYGSGKFFTVSLLVTNLAVNGGSATRAYTNMLHFAAPVLWVDADSPDPAPPYDSHENAGRQIHLVLQQAIDGCEVVIRRGAYHVSDGQAVHVTKALRMRSEHDDPLEVELYHASNNGGRPLRVDNKKAWVSGLTLRDGYNAYGMGVMIDQHGGVVSNCVMRHSVLSDNSPGIGAYLNSANALLTHCVISNNSAQANMHENAFVYINAGRVENCLVTDNTIRLDANGVNQQKVSLVQVMNGSMRNCTIAGNEVTEYGAIRGDNRPASVTQCVIAGNTLKGTSAPLWTANNRVA
ncbi:MAG: PKD domain-containing protein, partial [Kiritimatiellaeota bacterium]|nr:PKD domain-containing protein [Kiritimatiellota bacterium]